MQRQRRAHFQDGQYLRESGADFRRRCVVSHRRQLPTGRNARCNLSDPQPAGQVTRGPGLVSDPSPPPSHDGRRRCVTVHLYSYRQILRTLSCWAGQPPTRTGYHSAARVDTRETPMLSKLAMARRQLVTRDQNQVTIASLAAAAPVTTLASKWSMPGGAVEL